MEHTVVAVMLGVSLLAAGLFVANSNSPAPASSPASAIAAPTGLAPAQVNVAPAQVNVETAKLKVEGMWCPSCSPYPRLGIQECRFPGWRVLHGLPQATGERIRRRQHLRDAVIRSRQQDCVVDSNNSVAHRLGVSLRRAGTLGFLGGDKEKTMEHTVVAVMLGVSLLAAGLFVANSNSPAPASSPASAIAAPTGLAPAQVNLAPAQVNVETAKLKVEGLWCPSCSYIVRSVLMEVPGVPLFFPYVAPALLDS